jgi:hypothetical protein
VMITTRVISFTSVVIKPRKQRKEG